MFRNAMMSFASILSVTSTLVILGIVLLLILNVNNLTNEFTDKFDVMRVQVAYEYTPEQVDQLIAAYEADPNVESVLLITREEAFEQMKEDWGDEAELLEGLPDNPLSDTLEVRVLDVSLSDETYERLDNIDPNDTIYYYKTTIERILRISNVIRNVGIILIVVLLFITMLVINNTVRIGIASRKSQIQIMRYVGATRGYIRHPYLIEGIILGILGSVISSVLLYYGYLQVTDMAAANLADLTAQPLLNADVVILRIGILNLIIGIGVGLIGSLFSVRKYLKV
jgi:cell division transport system permease protein